MKKLLDWMRGSARAKAPASGEPRPDDRATAMTAEAIVKAKRASVEYPDGPLEYWQMGDLAQLQSGGPTMTITKIGFGVLQCTWFNGTKLKKEWFPNEALVEADED